MNHIYRLRVLLALMCAAFMVAACGGGSSPNTAATLQTPASNACNDSAGCGTVYLAMTDADGDFLSYTVDVVSLTLKRANGTVVETLPNSARVDFAQYVDLTEFVTSATVPNGSYVEGTMRLDYSNASVTVEKNGQPAPATVVGPNGSPLGIVDVRVVLDNRNQLVVSPGRPSLLTLDFNLAATNTVDLSVTPAKITARPVLIASLDPVDEKELRLRGPLVSVDPTANTYTIDVRPFNHPNARHGRVVVHTTGTTTFEVNGQSSTGAAGLQALAGAGAGTATVAFGALARADRTFTAERVHAGTSVPGQGVDTVIGTIMSRTGNELIVRGGTIVRTADPSSALDDRANFDRADIKVLVGPSTVVMKDGAGVQSLGAQALSVGQLIHANGALNSAGGGNVLDASQGRVRMHLTHAFGTVLSTNPGLMTLNLAALNERRISAFNFAGTGASPAQDANPANYEVQTSLALSMPIVIGSPLAAWGFVMPFGTAPPDFDARSLVSYADTRVELGIGWGEAGTAAPFSSLNASALVLNLSDPNIGIRHHLHVGPMIVDLNSLPSSPSIVGAASGMTMYVIVKVSGIEHYGSFADFVTALSTGLNGATRMVGFYASGTFDRTANTLTAKSAVAVLK